MLHSTTRQTATAVLPPHIIGFFISIAKDNLPKTSLAVSSHSILPSTYGYSRRSLMTASFPDQSYSHHTSSSTVRPKVVRQEYEVDSITLVGAINGIHLLDCLLSSLTLLRLSALIMTACPPLGMELNILVILQGTTRGTRGHGHGLRSLVNDPLANEASVPEMVLFPRVVSVLDTIYHGPTG